MNQLSEYKIKRGYHNDANRRIVLMDCMGTIVDRDKSLEKILYEWARSVGKEFGLHSRYLFNYRYSVVIGKMHNVVPISLIYQEIADQCIYYGQMYESTKELFLKRCHEIELDYEIHSQHIIGEAASFIKEQKTNNHKIYCVSDFRLSADDISLFLKKQNVLNYFDGIFSSCDFGKTKKEGSLYEAVLKEIGSIPSDCIMLGDNMRSDCINASKRGIESYLIK